MTSPVDGSKTATSLINVEAKFTTLPVDDVAAKITGGNTADGCEASAELGDPVENQTETIVTGTVQVPCNGTYKIAVTACTNVDGSPAEDCDATAAHDADDASYKTVSSTIDVAEAPATVPDVLITALPTGAKLTWGSFEVPPADLAGYIVERATSGAFTIRAGVAPAARSFVDSIPPSGGTFKWRVRAVRPSPGGPAFSNAQTAKVFTLRFAPIPTTSTTPHVDTPNRGQSPPPRISTPSTTDGGFDELLPYEPGGDEPVLPDDGFSSIYEDAGQPTGLLVPTAAAFVLAVWGAHLRYLNRMARQVR